MTDAEHQDNLETSPIANMALASKELFHSNFLAWAFKVHPITLKAILTPAGLQPIQKGVGVEVTREEQNLDLIVRIGTDRILVVENKLKSIPSRLQLDRYEEKAEKLKKGSERIEYVLLTLSGNDWSCDEDDPTWRHVSYKELGSELQGLIPSDAKPYNQYLVYDYAWFVQKLSDIADAESSDRWNRLLLPAEKKKNHCSDEEQEPSREWLKQHKLHDLFGKRQAHYVATAVYQILQRELRDKHGYEVKRQFKPADLKPSELTVYSGFSNSQAIVGVYWALPNLGYDGNEGKSVVGIGIQVQGNQFRSYIEWPKPRDATQELEWRSLSDNGAKIARALFCHEQCPKSFWISEDKSAGYNEQCIFKPAFHYRYKLVRKKDELEPRLDDLAEEISEKIVSLRVDLPKIVSILVDLQGG